MLPDLVISSEPTSSAFPPLQVYSRRHTPAHDTQPTIIESHSDGGPPPLAPTDLDISIAFRKGISSCTQHPIVNYVSFGHFSPSFPTFAMSITL